MVILAHQYYQNAYLTFFVAIINSTTMEVLPMCWTWSTISSTGTLCAFIEKHGTRCCICATFFCVSDKDLSFKNSVQENSVYAHGAKITLYQAWAIGTPSFILRNSRQFSFECVLQLYRHYEPFEAEKAYSDFLTTPWCTLSIAVLEATGSASALIFSSCKLK